MFFIIFTGALCLVAEDVDFKRLEELKHHGKYGLLLEESDRIKRENRKMSMSAMLKLDHFFTTGLLGCRRYQECLSELNSMIEKPKPDSLRYYDMAAYIRMNDIFCAIGAADLAQTALSKAGETLEIVETSCNNPVYKKCYDRLHMAKSVLAQATGDVPEALREWRQLKNSYSGWSYETRITWLGLGGSLLQDNGDEDNAVYYFVKALEEPYFSPNKTAILVRYVLIDIERADYAGALGKLRYYGDVVANEDNPLMRVKLLQTEGYALHGYGKYKEASEKLQEAIYLEDSISQADSRLMNSMLAERISPEDYSALKKKVETAESRTQRVIIISLVCGMILLGILCLILILKIRASRKAKNMETRMLRSEQEKETVADELSMRKKELCNVSLAAAQTETMLITVRSEMHRDSSSAEERLRSIESVLRESTGISQLQENFKNQFDETNQRLYTKLSLHHSDLTKTEMNMAAYVLLNLNSKDIARMTNRSVRTVDNIKYNLRKKLAITEPTAVYLRRLMSES